MAVNANSQRYTTLISGTFFVVIVSREPAKPSRFVDCITDTKTPVDPSKPTVL